MDTTTGKFRRARLLDRGYELRITDPDTSEVTWVTITRVVHITSPMRITWIWIEGDDEQYSYPSNEEIWSRTPAEVRRAQAQAQEA